MRVNLKTILIKSVLPTILLQEFAYSAEDDLYDFRWLDEDKEVYVLQNKIFPKQKKYYFDINGVKGLSSDYLESKGINFNIGYYINEEISLEIENTIYSHKSNETLNNLEIINGVTPFIRRVDKIHTFNFIWSPFYGKINTFNKIFYFDWSFGVGISDIKTSSNRLSALNPNNNEYNDEHFTGMNTKTNIKFHLNKNINFNLGIRGTFFRAYGPRGLRKKTNTNNDFMFGIGISF